MSTPRKNIKPSLSVAMAVYLTLFTIVPGALSMTDEVRNVCQQAEQLINMQRFSDAIKLLQRAGSMDPSCAEVHGYLGLAYQNSRNTRQALQEYQQALQLNPQMSFMNVNIGNCYLNLDQPDQAVPYLQKYLQENPNAPDAAQVQVSLQQAGARKGQQSLRGLMDQGQAMLNQHRYAEARRAFEQAVTIKPDWAPGHFFLGYALAGAGDNQRAISEFQSALQLDPSMKEAVLNIGSNYQSLGDSSSAIEWYQRYLQENPGSPKAGDIQNRINGLRQQANQQRGRPRQAASPASAYPSSTPTAAAMPPTVSSDPYEGMVPPKQEIPGGAYPVPAAQTYSTLPGNVVAAPAPQQPAYPAEPQPRPDDYFDNVASAGHYYRWPAEKMPLHVYIVPGTKVPGYRASFSTVLSESFQDWSKGSDNRVAFWMVQDPSQANIVCDWTADPNKLVEPGKPVEAGITKISGQEQPNGIDVKISQAKITLLTKSRGPEPLSDDDMKKACLHEIGHAIGISGHSSNNRDVMFYSESPSVWPALTKRDKATISHLYANYPRVLNP